MKTFLLTAAAVVLFAGSAMAQAGGNMEPRSPNYQNGASKAGGPANELNPNRGSAQPMRNSTRNENRSNTGNDTSKEFTQGNVPDYQKGASDAGGPANELNRGGMNRTQMDSNVTGTIRERNMRNSDTQSRSPDYQNGASKAGGPANELNRGK